MQLYKSLDHQKSRDQKRIRFQEVVISLTREGVGSFPFDYNSREDNDRHRQDRGGRNRDVQEMRGARLILVCPLYKYVSQNAVVLNEGN